MSGQAIAGRGQRLMVVLSQPMKYSHRVSNIAISAVLVIGWRARQDLNTTPWFLPGTDCALQFV
jgi:hypothetical protein